MPRLVIRLIIALAFIMPFAGCDSGTAPPTPVGVVGLNANRGNIEPGVVKGRVTDASGSPIPSVEVFADHTMFHSANVFGVSDANGDYRIELGDIAPSSWRVGAYITRDFDGITRKIPLHPDDAVAFAGATGAIRNLEWRVSGSTPEGGDYGEEGYIYLDGDLDIDYVILRFTLDGPLIDGSRIDTRRSIDRRQPHRHLHPQAGWRPDQ